MVLKFLWRQKGLWLRGALCLVIGITSLLAEKSSNYDRRYKIRGIQQPSKEIVVVHISKSDWIRFHNKKENWHPSMQEFHHFSDSFFWQPKTWSHLLKELLKNSPKSVGVLFYFGDNIRKPKWKEISSPYLTDERVIWASRLDSDSRSLHSVFANNDKTNVGLNEIKKDNDGFVRRFFHPKNETPHITQRLAQFGQALEPRERPGSKDFTPFINYQGPPGTFKSISFSKVLSGNYSQSFFKDKVVIVGSQDARGHIYHTPLGEMSRAEILATITDNIMENKWIERLNNFGSVLFLLLLLIFSIGIMSSYPQSVTLVFFFWIGTTITAFSLWIFDSFYFWIPILAPMSQLAVTYIVFLSFQLTVKEYLNWHLEQESENLLKVEQLKNNFVSLISHDLKTPIAKIQAICDRLLTQFPEHDFATDLSSLRKESSELHKYIQSILQVTKVESRDFKINKDAGDINKVIEEVFNQLNPLAKAKNILLSTDLEPMFLIEFDSVLIHEVVLNIVENAIKYTENNGKISVTSKEIDDKVYIIIEDTGQGISEEDQKKIFDKFYRGHEQETLTKGSGLGLYLSRYFIELHGGSIELESQLHKGTKISLSLPVTEDFAINELPNETMNSKNLAHAGAEEQTYDA